MNVEDLFFNIIYNKTCFLCLKTSQNMIPVIEKFEFKWECFNARKNLVEITKILFPSYDVLQTQSCENCADLLINMYIIVEKRKQLKKIITNTIENIYVKLKEFLNLENITNEKECDHLSSQLVIPRNNALVLNLTRFFFNKRTTIHKHKIELTTSYDGLQNSIQNPTHSIIRKNKTYICKHQRKKKNYKCKQCSYKTLCKASLEGHINKTHLQIRPFKCDSCSKGFYRKSNLVEHIQSHNDTKKLCELCGDVFRQKKSLVEHLRLHSNERPYECKICGKKFVTSGRRSDHIKRCHMEKTERCMLCNKQFGLKKELTRHMKSVHTKS